MRVRVKVDVRVRAGVRMRRGVNKSESECEGVRRESVGGGGVKGDHIRNTSKLLLNFEPIPI